MLLSFDLFVIFFEMLVHKDYLIALYAHFLMGACFLRNFEHVLKKNSILPFCSFGFLFKKTSLREFEELPLENSLYFFWLSSLVGSFL